MALKDQIPLGMSLPHRSLDRIAPELVVEIAQRAETFGFRELWVTENTILREPSSCMDALTLLTYAAAVTTTIRLGTSVVVLPVHSPLEVAHRVATIDYLSGGRFVLGVGMGRDKTFIAYQIPTAHRVTRFLESIELMKALWTEEHVSYHGRIYSLDDAMMGPKPVQKPHPPIWLGGEHPDNLERAVVIADGWMAGGAGTNVAFARCAASLRSALDRKGRDPEGFTISKRVFTCVDDRPARARAEINRWFELVYHNPEFTTSAGVWGTPEQVHEQLSELMAMGANHLLLNPVAHYREQLEQLADLVGFNANRSL